MPGKRITDLTALSGANSANNDDLVGTAINGIRRDNVNMTPVSNVTPRYAGEFYYVTTGSKLFFAVGSTNTDWIALN